MSNKTLALLLLALVLLAACGGDKEGPSDKQAKEIIYGMYIKDATIVKKTKCELTDWMEQDGQTEVWLVEYRFEDSSDKDGLLLTKEGDEWQSYLFGKESCPE